MKMWNLLIFWCDSEHSSVMKRSQWPACMTGVIHFKKAGHKLKTCEDYTFCNGQRVCYSQGVLFIDVLIVQRTIRATHYSMLLEDQINPTFRSKRRSRSFKSVCLLHDNARPHELKILVQRWMDELPETLLKGVYRDYQNGNDCV